MADALTLYGSARSRTFTARWMLAELDLRYAFEDVDIARGLQKQAAYLALNPMGKVPTLVDGTSVITETSAICLYLADRYGLGRLAPEPQNSARAAYLRWSVFATSVLEPALFLGADDAHARQTGWGRKEDALRALQTAVLPGPYVLADAFSAADVALGAVAAVAWFNKRFEPSAEVRIWCERLQARPAYQFAARATWPSS